MPKCICSSPELTGNGKERADKTIQQFILKSPHIGIAALFRWPDLLDSLDLPDGIWNHSEYATHPMPNPENFSILKNNPTSQCTSTNPTDVSPIKDSNFSVCCNPYHWCRVLRDPHPVAKKELEGRFLFLYPNK